MEPDGGAAKAVIKDGPRYSPIWLIPLSTIIVGLWMLFTHVNNLGNEIIISFETANGIEAGKTKVKVLNVDIGLVEQVLLNDDKISVSVIARINKEAASLLKKDSRFWVVRPRFGVGGISGLGTVLSGAFIEMAPGTEEIESKQFTGLENIPVTSTNIPGLHFKLTNNKELSLNVGEALIYQGFQVGQVEAIDFDIETKTVEYGIFVAAPYNELIFDNTRFWTLSAVQFKTDSQGFNIKVGSINTIISGGVTFDTSTHLPMGRKARMNSVYHLYEDRQSAFNQRSEYFAEYTLFFDESIRGLENGASVEYRGIRVGEVLGIPKSIAGGLELSTINQAVPVAIRLDPSRMGLADSPQGLEGFKIKLREQIKSGLTAKIEIGNYLTGMKLVTLDYSPQQNEVSIQQFGGHDVIPSTKDAFGQISTQLSALLTKLESLPLTETLNSATGALAGIEELTGRIGAFAAQQSTKEIPENLNATLQQLQRTIDGFSPDSSIYKELNKSLHELQKTMQSLQPVLRTLDNKPNALIFGGAPKSDPQPTKKEK